MLYAGGSRMELEIIHSDSEASGGPRGTVTDGVQSKSSSFGLATKYSISISSI